MWRATIKGLIAHKVRLGLTALAVVLGVGFVAGSFILTDTIGSLFDRLFKDVGKGIDVVVRPNDRATAQNDQRERQAGFGRTLLPQTVLNTVRSVPGVREAEGSVAGFVSISDKKGKPIISDGPPNIGLSWAISSTLSPLKLRSGRRPAKDGEVAIDALTAKKFGYKPGDKVKLVASGPAEEFIITGIAGFGAADNIGGATLAAFDLATAQRLLGAGDKFDSIGVVGAPDQSASILRQKISAKLPQGVEALTQSSIAQENAKRVKQGIKFFTTVLLVFASISLFVGAFIIFNTFSIIVAQRSKEIALLRALGASRGQVIRSVVGESAVVGIISSGIGLAFGVGIAITIKAVMKAFGIDIPSSGTVFKPRTAEVAMGLGVGITLISSFPPALRASRTAPVEAMKGVAERALKPIKVRAIVGAIIATLGALVLSLGLFVHGPKPVPKVGTGAALMFFGIAVMSPLLVRPLARTIGAPIAKGFGMPGKLSRQNSMRDRRRTASTASALMIGVSLVTLVTILAASTKLSFNKVIGDFFKADYIVSQQGRSTGFSSEVADRLKRLSSVSVVNEVRTGAFRIDGKDQTLASFDATTVSKVVDLDIASGSIDSIKGPAVLVHKDQASKRKLHLGDRLKMQFAGFGDKELTVGAIFRSDFAPAQFVVSTDNYRKSFDNSNDFAVLVKTKAGTSHATSKNQVDKALADFPQIQVQDEAQFFEQGAKQLDQLLGLVRALLALSIVIALIGITNTLALSVFERTRELGLLRAVGMTRRQVRAMIRGESVIIALIGTALGLALGSFFGWAIVKALASQGIREFVFPATQLLVVALFAGLAGVLAAVFPARRAARLDVLTAIATE
ncbi:MAG: ABC transporter permease [Actinomycetota bacterium]|nr:FtsX-like permease family protein [Actinomycetota bacterium]